jgi:hypothetical protein
MENKKTKKMVKKQNKNSNKIKIMTFIFIIVILFSIFTYAYYTNTHKFFEDSRKNDGNSGFALERDSSDFIEDGCGSGTMLDTVTGLCWLKDMNTFGQKDWSPALTDCSNLDYAGHSNWELPTKPELYTLIDEIGPSGSTCTTLINFGFTNCQDSYYWSSNEYQPDTAYAWHVDFNGGADGSLGGTGTHYVTCVRRDS